MCGLNLGAVGNSNARSITHRLLVIAWCVEFETVAGTDGIGDDCGIAGGGLNKKALQIN